MKHQLFSHLLIGVAILLSSLAGAMTVVLFSAVRDDTSSASLALQATAGVLITSHPLKIGLAYIPPDKDPGDRIYVEEGFEAQLAQEIGDRLGASIELVPVQASQYESALSDGRIDAVIARLHDNDPLHRTARVMRTGYASGLSPVARSDRPLKSWKDLAGQIVCITEANDPARRIAESVGSTVQTLRAPAQALMLVRTGECDAAIHDQAVLNILFAKLSWHKFSATLPPVETTSLVVAVAAHREALAQELSRAISDISSQDIWQKRRERWASLVAFEVYRDQVAVDCH